MSILVCGATGKCGGAAVRALVENKVACKALVRDDTKDNAKALAALDGVTLVKGDFGDSKSLDAAMLGIKRVFLVSAPFLPPGLTQDENEINVLKAAKKAGVEHVVRVSTCHPLIDVEAPILYGRAHAKVERFANTSACPPLTDLNPDWFFENFGIYAASGVVAIPVTSGNLDVKYGQISVVDIGAAGAALLSIDAADIVKHAGKKYELHGPALVSFRETTADLSKVAGRTIAFESITAEQFTKNCSKLGFPEAASKSFGNTYALMSGDKKRFRPYTPQTDPALLALYTPKITSAEFAKTMGLAFKAK